MVVRPHRRDPAHRPVHTHARTAPAVARRPPTAPSTRGGHGERNAKAAGTAPAYRCTVPSHQHGLEVDMPDDPTFTPAVETGLEPVVGGPQTRRTRTRH